MKEENDKKAMADIRKIIGGIREAFEKNKQEVIEEMVDSMRVQQDIIRRAAKKGIIINEIMSEIKDAFEKRHTPLKD